VSGFRWYCDVGSGVARFQTFVPGRTGTLSAVSYTSFQAGNPDAGLEISVYRANDAFQPTGDALSSTLVPAAQIGWSPRDVTVAPGISVVAGQRYGLLVRSATTTGCSLWPTPAIPYGYRWVPYPDGSSSRG
jgi:hypothetical protein